MTISRVYLAGPMAGVAEHNYPLFNSEAARLRALGYTVMNPAEINVDFATVGRAVCMRRDIAALITCDTLAVLPGWEQSQGTMCERTIATQLDMKIVDAAWLRMKATAESPVPQLGGNPLTMLIMAVMVRKLGGAFAEVRLTQTDLDEAAYGRVLEGKWQNGDLALKYQARTQQ